MLIDFSLTIRNNRLTQILNGIDAGGDQGKIKYYTGTKPAVGGAITDQILVGTSLFAYPCGSVANAVLTFSFANNGETQAVATGDITWARLTTSADVFVADVDVSNNAGTGVIKMDSTQIYNGGTLRVNSGVINEP